MVAVRLAISSNVHQLWFIFLIHKSTGQPVAKVLAVIQQTGKSHVLRDGPIIEKNHYFLAGRKIDQIGRFGVNSSTANIPPAFTAYLTDPFSLVWRQNREPDAMFCHKFQG